MIIAGTNSVKLAGRIAKLSGKGLCAIEKKYFPDGEIYVRFAKNVRRRDVFIIQSFQPNPQDALAEILLAAGSAKDLGAKHVTLIAPYLGYMRQDNRFNEGEAVSAMILSKLIGSNIDRLITIDPHAHRIRDLSKIFHKPVDMLTANRIIAEFIKREIKADIITGPDVESSQWASKIAGYLGIEAVILKKKRYSSRKVRVELTKHVIVKNKSVVIADDIISTGHTMAEAIKTLKKLGAKKVYCIGVHGLFVEDAEGKLRNAGADGIITCNTIENKFAKIDVAKLISDCI